MEGARGVLFNIMGGADLTMSEVDEASKIIKGAADPDANIIFGATIDETIKDQIKITVIATGFDESRRRLAEMVKQDEYDPNPNASQNMNNSSGDDEEEQKKDDQDVFDIPAFLRQRN